MHSTILMIYPETPATYWGLTHSLFGGNKALIPPLGLMTVAALLPAEYTIRLVDMNIEPLTDDDLIAADLVFISAMIIQKDSFDRVVHRCHRHKKFIVAGGPYPTTSHRQIQGVDCFVLGEAEISLPPFLDDYQNQRLLRKVYESGERAEMSESPVPRYDLINHRAYAIMPLQFSRGCPYNCEFCDIIEMLGRVPRTKSPSQVLAELDAIAARGFRGGIFVVDDNFIGNRTRTRELLREIVIWQNEHGRPFTLGTEASINLAADDELMDLMVAAGFNTVFIGIETPDEAGLSSAQKKHNLGVDLGEAVATIQKRGIIVLGGFIIGFDTDAPDIFDRQIRFIQSAGIPHAMVGLLMALPGTQLFRRLERENRIISSSTGSVTHDTGQLNFIPRMPLDTLLSGYRRVLAEIYRPSRYFARSLVLMKRIPRNRSISAAGARRGFFLIILVALMKKAFSRYGLYYALFLIKTIHHNPRNLAYAAMLGIRGSHYNRITRDFLRTPVQSPNQKNQDTDIRLKKTAEM